MAECVVRAAKRSRPLQGTDMGAAKASSFSKWGCLSKCDITEDQRLNVIVGGDPIHNSCLPTDPTYGIILELYYFANEVSCSLRRRSNRILKCLVDILFPNFSISRADRLERRVKILCAPLENMTMEELDENLRRKWIPQPTGTLCTVMHPI